MTKTTYKDFIRQENELTKLKIQAEFGINLMKEEKDMNPAIENIWLNNILEFERAMISNKKITVEEFLGNPSFIPSSNLPDDKLPSELQRLMELLRSKNMVVDSLCEVEDREMYRFITDELFKTETDSNIPKNMIVCFIYEEFHPNDEYDIKNMCQDVIRGFESENQYVYQSFFKKPEGENEQVRMENILRKISAFKNAFEKIDVEEVNIDSLECMGDEAILRFNFKLGLFIQEGKQKQSLFGKGVFECIRIYDYWHIKDMKMDAIV
jgi:hypothetical protein